MTDGSHLEKTLINVVFFLRLKKNIRVPELCRVGSKSWSLTLHNVFLLWYIYYVGFIACTFNENFNCLILIHSLSVDVTNVFLLLLLLQWWSPEGDASLFLILVLRLIFYNHFFRVLKILLPRSCVMNNNLHLIQKVRFFPSFQSRNFLDLSQILLDA